MKNIISSILISIIITFLGIFYFYNYFSIGEIEEVKSGNNEEMLGATITEIQGSDTIKDSRTVINTNFTNLNNDKIEISTTTLPLITTLSGLVSVGTLTSGALGTGFTAVNVPQGGTGSTTLSQYQVLLGNGTNAISVVSGFGNAGHALLSQGAGNPPVWGDPIITGYAFNATTTKYTATGAATWTKPTGAKRVFVQVWGGGGSGGAFQSAGTDQTGGGGGGGYVERWFEASDLGATESISVGAGGAAVSGISVGNAGNNSTFGASETLITGYGGGAGSTSNSGGGGGGVFSVGGNGSGSVGGAAGSPGSPIVGTGGGGVVTSTPGFFGGGGGGGATYVVTGYGSNSYFGGGGGGMAKIGTGVGSAIGGTSVVGGSGGAGSHTGNATAGTQPAGGGGGCAYTSSCTSGKGGDGQVIVTTFF